MQKPLNTLSVMAVVLFLVTQIFASQAIVTRKATLRHDPSTKHPPILTLAPPDDVELIDPSPTHGYYHVRTADNQDGWIYGRSVRVIQDATSTNGTAATTGPSNTGTTAASSSGPADTGISGTIPQDWDKPAPNETQFDGPDGTCGPSGDGGDTATNIRKNRTDTPASYHVVTWKALQSLPYPVAKKSLAEWTPQQLSAIQPYEGDPVSVVGYLVAIKVEDRGSGESTNCHFTNAKRSRLAYAACGAGRPS